MTQENGNGFEILSHAPTRISFAGGGTDISPYPETYGGCALNATISIYMIARLRPRKDPKVVISANTRPKPMVYPSVRNLTHDGHLDFVKMIVNKMPSLQSGFELYIYSSLPMQSGLGGSASMCVAVLNAFKHLTKAEEFDGKALAELAYEIETKELGNPSGRQDQYAAAYGGINLFEFNGGSDVRVTPVDITSAACRMLNHALVLFRVGQRRPSGGIVEDHVAGIQAGGAQLEALHTTKRRVPEMLQAIQAVDIRRIGKLLDELWQEKKRFSRFITNEYIDMLYSRLQEAGMLGGKITGAGGGGHLLACCDMERRDQVIAAGEQLGLRAIPFTFVHESVLSWESQIRTVEDSAYGAYAPDSEAAGEVAEVEASAAVTKTP